MVGTALTDLARYREYCTGHRRRRLTGTRDVPVHFDIPQGRSTAARKCFPLPRRESGRIKEAPASAPGPAPALARVANSTRWLAGLPVACSLCSTLHGKTDRGKEQELTPRLPWSHSLVNVTSNVATASALRRDVALPSPRPFRLPLPSPVTGQPRASALHPSGLRVIE